jgi:Holliday junction resolvase-like predicted endonuclease
LRALGWRVLGSNVRTSAGEVDVVALDRGEVVCVEVKTARVADAREPQRDEFRPGRHFDARRLARQLRAAAELARESGVPGRGRVDLLEVVLDGRTGRAQCTLHRAMTSGWRVRR